MKKILFLLAMLPMMVFTACSSDDEEPKVKKEVIIYNNIDKSDINESKYDGVLYEVYILTGDGLYPLIGDIQNGEKKSFYYPEESESDRFAVLLKLGLNETEAKKDNFTVLSNKSNKEMLFFTAKENRPLEISISEEFYFRYVPYSNIIDVVTAIEGSM